MYVEYYTDTDTTCNEVILIFETTRSNKQYKFSFQGNILVSLSFNSVRICAHSHTIHTNQLSLFHILFHAHVRIANPPFIR